LPNSEHPCHKCLDNRSEHSHRPVRKRKRAIQRFKSPEQARRFLETFSPICNHFRPRHSLSAQRYPEIMHGLSAQRYTEIMRDRFRQGREIARPALSA